MSKFNVQLKKFSKLYKYWNTSLKVAIGSVTRYQFLKFWQEQPDNTTILPKQEDKSQEKSFQKYWSGQVVDNILEESDKLFSENKYLEVYELLNRTKFQKNPQIQWRLARTLLEISTEDNIKIEIKNDIIQEAFDIMESVLEIGGNDADVHKWYAIVLDKKYSLMSLEERIRHFDSIKKHIKRACELNPNDVVAHYMLGRWCYEMVHLSKLQRFISKMLYAEPPESSYKEAYKYLSQAEAIHPGLIVPNTYLLGKTCIKLGEYHRGHYYMTIVANSKPKDDKDKWFITKAKKCCKQLEHLGTERDVLFFDVP